MVPSIVYFLAGKFGAVFASIPFPIFAALYCVLFGLVGMALPHLYVYLIVFFLVSGLVLFLSQTCCFQLQWDCHFFSSQTWIPCETSLLLGCHSSLGFLSPSSSMNIGIPHTTASSILMLDGWVCFTQTWVSLRKYIQGSFTDWHVKSGYTGISVMISELFPAFYHTL